VNTAIDLKKAPDVREFNKTHRYIIPEGFDSAKPGKVGWRKMLQCGISLSNGNRCPRKGLRKVKRGKTVRGKDAASNEKGGGGKGHLLRPMNAVKRCLWKTKWTKNF